MITRPKPLPRIVAPSANTLTRGDWIGVTIPATPAPETSPNDRSHYQVKARARKALREAAYLATVSVVNRAVLTSWDTPFPAGTTLQLSIVIGWEKGRRAHDSDNAVACVKAAIDGFAHALGIDDSWFTIAGVEQVRDHDGIGWTRITAVPAEGTTDQESGSPCP